MSKDSTRPVMRIQLTGKSIWQVIGAVLLTLGLLWAMGQMRSLLWMLILSFFFSLALQPGVNWCVQRFGWRRGSAVGAIYGIGFLGGGLMILILIPAIAELAQTIGESGSEWIANGSAWLSDTFGVEFPSPGTGDDVAQSTSQIVEDWAKGAIGNLVGIATIRRRVHFQRRDDCDVHVLLHRRRPAISADRTLAHESRFAAAGWLDVG